jgi:hypothetical protein
MTDRHDAQGFDAQLARVLGAPTTAVAGPCPDAQTLAGWLDGSLDAGARTDCERHLAACPRCQSVLAVADAASEADAPAQVVTAVPQPEPARVTRFPWRTVAWVSAPLALAASALVAVWVSRDAARPAAPREVVRQETTTAGGVPQQAPAASPGEMAQPRANEAKTTPRRASPTASPPAADAEADQSVAARTREPAPPRPVASAEAPAQVSAPASGAVGGAVAASPAPAPPPAPVAFQRAEEAVSQSALKSVVADERARRAAADLQWTSPSGRVTWTLSPDGRLFRRAAGTAPEVVASLATTLAAGAAQSDDIAWGVGRQGAVWRTVDGRTWQRVPGPTSDDLVAVTVGDNADTTTVVTAAGRRFTTRDGGKSWAP